jgi:HK97 family phage prohead protease
MGGIMIIRTKSGEMMTANGSVLLELLGVKNETGSVQKVAGDLELVAAVPIINEQLKMNNEEIQEGFAWTLSTFDLDRFNERIDPLGWDFKQFLKNPVVEWSHNFLIPAIGKIDGLTVDDNGLHGRVIFNGKDYDHFGWSIGQRVAAGVIRAGSVGFRVLEIEIPDRETAKDGTSLIIRKQELVEFSICNVPANPYALAKREKRNEEREKEEESGGMCGFWDCLINEE